MKLISQGAEAKLFLKGKIIIKDRFKKKYRIKEIDERLRKARTKREAKSLDLLSAINFPAPHLIDSDEKERIEIEFISGPLVKDVLEKRDYTSISEEIGKKIAVLHNNDIIHGDLTTSNMILKNEVYFIDFGLSYSSKKIEDRAVDLHLLKQALESKHHKIWEECFLAALKGYEKESAAGKEVIKRLETVEKRGRYKAKKK